MPYLLLLGVLCSCPAIDGSVQPERRLPAGVSWAVLLLLRPVSECFSAERQQQIEGTGSRRRRESQNTQPYARRLDVHDDVQVAPISLLVDLHRAVRDRLHLRALGMLLQIELLARRAHRGLEAWFALMYFD